MTPQREAHDILVAILSRHTADPKGPHHKVTFVLVELIGRLERATNAYARLAAVECDRSLTDREQRRAERLGVTLGELAKSLGVGLRLTTGDPRGFVVKLLIPNPNHPGQNYYNTWGGSEEGWGIA